MNKHRKTIRASFLSSEAKGDPFDRLARATVGEWDEAKHRHISPEEVALLNSLEIPGCPYCGSASFVCWGRTRHGVRRYRCKSCLETFGPLTGTLFDSHKIGVS